MRLFIGVFLFISMNYSFTANAGTHCACEIGDVKKEKFFYKIGCDMWLNTKKCNSRKVVDRKFGTELSQYLPKMQSGDRLEIGYVGHWFDTWQTIDYIEKHILPIAKINGVEVRYDNTACNPMKDPEGMQEYLMGLDIPQQSLIQVRGNQNLSIGMWDELYAGNTSFYAYASTEWSTAKFPPCESFEGKMCAAKFQAGEKGRCYNRQIKRLVWLTCQKPKSGKTAFEWTRN